MNKWHGKEEERCGARERNQYEEKGDFWCSHSLKVNHLMVVGYESASTISQASSCSFKT